MAIKSNFLRIDNCKYCAAVTHTNYTDLHRLLSDIEFGEMGCWLCNDDGEYHSEFDIFAGIKKVWCGHLSKCSDVENSNGSTNGY